ncbi:hypothetical protein [Acinetobacter sp. TR11]|nr:hypothetical protein [Acinetobacter sp. TR11]WAU72730.1 hypothetical protein O1450_11585 [Acinetobacter sp. TR11]
MGKDRQLFRMDYHSWNVGATGVKNEEIHIFKDDPFHYHVMKWGN